ncbi:MAG: alcohol dehydrogenase catalytic domain-containing protein [Caldilineaceae bacterium]|nr:alcohol dehydrogenase catalytic domain-containing protein [Caldilineaceae bacterium]
MKALVWEAPREMRIREQDVPRPGPGETLIKVDYAGICGSELSGYLGHNALRVPPLVMGHEFAGTVAEVGPAVSDSEPSLSTGDAVTVNPLYCTGESELQTRGLDQLCPTRQLVGAHVPGAYAEYVAVPTRTVHPLPAGMSTRVGALTEPVGCGVRIGELAGNVRDATCLIVGMGPIGLLALQVLLRSGAQDVVVADLDAERLAMGERYGGIPIDPAESDPVEEVLNRTDGVGAVASVDAVGTGRTRTQCVAGTMATGTVILSGLHEETSEIPAADIIRREIMLRGSFSYSPANFREALVLLNQEEISLEPWIVEAPLADGGQWFDRLIDAPGDVSKVLLVPESQ